MVIVVEMQVCIPSASVRRSSAVVPSPAVPRVLGATPAWDRWTVCLPASVAHRARLRRASKDPRPTQFTYLLGHLSGSHGRDTR